MLTGTVASSNVSLSGKFSLMKFILETERLRHTREEESTSRADSAERETEDRVQTCRREMKIN